MKKTQRKYTAEQNYSELMSTPCLWINYLKQYVRSMTERMVCYFKIQV